ncbi:MAG: acyl-CoA dehydratase activase [Candidatus Eisenbacteria bacterium]|nr:acyl-CoA dehydratase activase [Candidatus Eisenbacteria bacterium]
MTVFVGLDVGSISAKAALLLEEKRELATEVFPQNLRVGSLFIYLSRYTRVLGNPMKAASGLLSGIRRQFPDDTHFIVKVTGSGSNLIASQLGAERENEFKAIARGVGTLHCDVKTIFEMGGENSKYIRISTDTFTNSIGIEDYETNGDCAAGTGSFMDQQASRLLYDVEEIGKVALCSSKCANIAGRCSVFAKSDMIHAQQKGAQPPEILKGLCLAVARNFKGNIVKGKTVVPRVAFIGGVAANEAVVDAIKSVFELKDDELLIPDYHAYYGAIGASLLARESSKLQAVPDFLRLELESRNPQGGLPFQPVLSMDKVILLRDRVEPYVFPPGLPVDCYLGIDVGSVSTNLAVVDPEGNVIKEIYLRTEGRPVEVVGRGLSEIQAELSGRIEIMGVGTTGSGRELIGELVGADTVNDEITAHKTGATFIAEKMLNKKVDTIFEIGGQDAKFINVEEGVVVDFTMNEACAAGTGSFLEEQAERLGVRIEGEFAGLALSTDKPIRLGERCTVFMEQDVNSFQQRAASKDALVAGLAYSVVYNYLNRVVRGRNIGDTIFFQGGTAYNDAVAAAFSKVLEKDIIVPPYNGVIGAIGEALLAKEKVNQLGVKTKFRGFDITKISYKMREFVCKACANYCDMQEFIVEGQKTFWGDKCSDKFRKRAKTDKKPVIKDLVAIRETFLMEGYEEPAPDRQLSGDRGAPVVGMPRAMYFYERFPFWRTYLSCLGATVAISAPTSAKIVNQGIEATVAEPCFPVQVAHGHIVDLIEKKVDFIFLPNVINAESDYQEANSFLCPWGQTLAFVVEHAPFFEEYKSRLLKPTVHMRYGPKHVEKELRKFAVFLGASEKRNRDALNEAYKAQGKFFASLRALGEEALGSVMERDEAAIVIVGRPYNIYDRGVNMNIPSKLRDYYGINVIPLDFLPLDDEDVPPLNRNMFWNYGRKILQASKIVNRCPNFHILYITNFKCGPDSYIKHFTGPASGKPFLSLQFDGHGSDAGMLTRCEAYLDSKGLLRWWKQKRETLSKEELSTSRECLTQGQELLLQHSNQSG